jgi:alpha-L-rhamnosidase
VLTGWVRVHVTGPAGTTITLRHCETLTAGEPDYSTNRTAQATDRFTLRGQGVERFEPRFTFHGFRYVDVEGWPGELDPGALVAVVVHSDLTRIGWLETSNELVNQLHRNVVWSMRGNFVGVPTDCPQRDERLGWTGDINAFAPTAGFLYDVSGFLGSWLADLAAEQAAKGYVPLTVPDAMRTKVSPTALWTDVAVSLPWLLYWEYGDVEILRRQYASMTAFIDSVEPMLDSHGLWAKGFQFGDWLDPDAPPDNPAGGKTDAHLVATAYLCRTTAELARTADVLGHTGDAERYRRLHERVRDGFRHEWVSPAGLLVSETATAYALAICFDILDPAQKRRAGHRLAQVVAKDGYRISTGFAGTPLVMPALSETGQVETAYRLLLRTGCPSFLYPVTMGATTIWERWDAILPDGSLNDTGMTSLNHYALGAVADWLHRTVGGLTATEPGYRAMRIAPRPGGDLTYARLRLDTPHGPVRVCWDVDGLHRRVEVTIPDGTQADVILPDHPQELRPQVGPGVHSWEYTLAPAPRRTYSLDSSVAEIAADPNAWPAVRDVFARHFPAQAPSGETTAGSSAFGSGSLRDILGFVPRHLAERLEADLQDALSA